MDKTYQQMYEESQGKNIGEDLTQIFISWDEEGQAVVGEFLYTETVVGKEDMGEVCRYVLKTDQGTCSCILGGATDKQLSDKLAPGDLISITYGGKSPIQGGSKQVNHFDVRRFGRAEQFKVGKNVSGGK